jgi:transposase
VVSSTDNVIVEKTIPGSSLFAIIFGILLGVGIILCILGIFMYRRYKRRKEESDLEKAATEVDQHNTYNQKKKINSVDAVNQSGESPLKGYRDNTIYDDDEALEEQYHPMSHRLYNPYSQDEFNSNRKAKEEDYLMTQ